MSFQQSSLPVHGGKVLAGRQQVGPFFPQLHQLHEEVRLRQREQRVDHRKLRLVEAEAHLQTIFESEASDWHHLQSVIGADAALDDLFWVYATRRAALTAALL